jgi:hypothetical protein
MSLFGDYKLLDFKALDNKFSGDWLREKRQPLELKQWPTPKKVEETAALKTIQRMKINDTLWWYSPLNTSQLLSDLDGNTQYGRRFARYILRSRTLLDALCIQKKEALQWNVSWACLTPELWR